MVLNSGQCSTIQNYSVPHAEYPQLSSTVRHTTGLGTSRCSRGSTKRTQSTSTRRSSWSRSAQAPHICTFTPLMQVLWPQQGAIDFATLTVDNSCVFAQSRHATRLIVIPAAWRVSARASTTASPPYGALRRSTSSSPRESTAADPSRKRFRTLSSSRTRASSTILA